MAAQLRVALDTQLLHGAQMLRETFERPLVVPRPDRCPDGLTDPGRSLVL
jgi:hypothetical protein